jgi:hypothetical protein
MVPKGNRAVEHNAHTLLVANVSTERLGGSGFVFYRNDLVGKPFKRHTVTPFLHRKTTKLRSITATILVNVKSNKTFSYPLIKVSSIKFTSL